MDVMNDQQARREAELMQANREELVERMARAMREDGTAQPLPGLRLNRCSLPLTPVYGVLVPSVAGLPRAARRSRLLVQEKERSFVVQTLSARYTT